MPNDLNTGITLHVPLTALSGELTALAAGNVPTYRKLYMLVLDGKLPAAQVNGRYQVARSDLPGICTALGLRLKETAAPAKARKAQAAPVSAAA